MKRTSGDLLNKKASFQVDQKAYKETSAKPYRTTRRDIFYIPNEQQTFENIHDPRLDYKSQGTKVEKASINQSTEYSTQSTKSSLETIVSPTDQLFSDSELTIKAQQLRLSTLRNPDYMDSQTNLNHEKRFILLEWLFQVAAQSQYSRETMHLAIVLFDCFMSNTHEKVEDDEIQLIGVTCLMISAKMEETKILHVADYLRLTDNAYDTEQITSTEVKILRALGWNLNLPSLATWANLLISKWDNYADSNRNSKSLDFRRDLPWFDYLFSVVDLVAADVKSLSYDPMACLCAVLYLICGLHRRDFGLLDVIRLHREESFQVLNFCEDLNLFFDGFLVNTLGVGLSRLDKCVVSMSKYFVIQCDFSFDSARKVDLFI